MIKVKLIVCCDANYGIGKNNKLPWSIPKEMKIFKEKTIGKYNNCVIMGKNTFNSIPENFKPLQNRHNCILTKNKITPINNNITILNNIEELKQWIIKTNYEDYWIIGGKILYESILSTFMVDEIHLSKLEKNYDCDCFFDKSILFDSTFEKIDEVNYKNEQFTHMVFKYQNKDCL